MIHRDSPLPLYHQLKRLLMEKIETGEWRSGELIPGELELQEQYALSRNTVRQALRELELDGLLTRYRGRGTFVARPKLTHDPEEARGLSRTYAEQGVDLRWRVLSATWESAKKDVAHRLQIAEGEEIFVLRRLRLSGDEAIGHHVAAVPRAFAESVDRSSLEQGGSLKYLEGNPALAGAVVERFLEAATACEEDRVLLEATAGAPVLRIRRLLSTRTGRPIEDCRSVYRGDRFQYHLRSGPPQEERLSL